MSGSRDRDEEVRRLFAEAMERPAAERGTWLESACGDPEVRQEVSSLLEAADSRGADVDQALARLPRLGDVAEAVGSRADGAASGETMEASSGHGGPSRSAGTSGGLIGQEIAHYRVLERVGQGGMGEVYRARDLRLGRTVALKFLPPELTRDPVSRERFRQEAQAASALDDSAICTIHEIRDEGERPYIVMAFVEGETLRERTRRRPLPVEEAVDIATQVARGLTLAHGQGIVHRDVKSSNVMITAGGRVKILDFGLAKVPDVSLSRSGVTLGTVTCMSPEQVRGDAVDARTDIWALGVLLYEMITGRLPFRGDHPAAVIRGILDEHPEPMTALRTGVPLGLDGVVAKALAKDLADRYQHIDEIPVDLRRALSGRGAPESPPRQRPPGSSGSRSVAAGGRGASWATTGSVATLGLVAALAVVVAYLGPWGAAPAPSPTVRFDITLPTGYELSSWWQPLALSPDGTRIAYSATAGGETRVYMRAIERVEPRPVPGTEAGHDPFFSPDGRWIAFFAEGELRRVDTDAVGAIPQTVVSGLQGNNTGHWGTGDTIFLTQGVTSGILRVPASEGTPEPVTVPDQEVGEIGHLWPRQLPGGGGLLFTVWSDRGMLTAHLPPGEEEWRIVHEGGAAARYLATGHLVVADMSVAAARPGLLAIPFDLERGQATGPSLSVVGSPGLGGPNFAVSGTGTLVYVAGGSPAWIGLDRNVLVWRGPGGEISPAAEAPGYHTAPRISPDGGRLALADMSPTGTYDVWVLDPGRGTRDRVSGLGTINNFPVWSRDGTSLTFNSSRRSPGIYRKAAAGSGAAERLLARAQHPEIPGSWSPDDSILVYTKLDAQGRGDLWIWSEGGDPSALLDTPASESAPRFSPDGTLLAYVSDASGRDEVYVRPFPGPGPALALSTGGGREPVWAPDGGAVFYRTADAMMEVPIRRTPELDPGPPRRLFDDPYVRGEFSQTSYDVAEDGRFLLVESVDADVETRFSVVLNWLSELEGGRGG